MYLSNLIKPLFLLMLPFLLNATSLSTLIESTKKNHISLKAIEQRLSAIDNEYDISRNFLDPEISFGISDIQLQNPTNRSLEPMQYTSINIKQKFPYFGKRDAASQKVNAKKEKVTLSLKEAKIKLIESIKITAYNIWQIQEQLKINKNYIKLTKQNIDLYTSYTSNDTKAHIGIMSAELTLSQLKIKKNKLENLLTALYKQISYLSATKTNSLDINLQIQKPKNLAFYIDKVTNNLTYKAKTAITKEAKADLKVKELAKKIDPFVQVGYYNRDDYKDYININIGFSVPLYGTQNSNEEKSRKLLLASKIEMIDYKNSLIAKIHNQYAKLQDSYTTYNIIKDESLIQIQHMFDLTNTSIQNGSNLFTAIELLTKKLNFEEQSIQAITNYHKTNAILNSLIGEE